MNSPLETLLCILLGPIIKLSSSAECADLSHKVNITCKLVWVNVIIFNPFQLGEYGKNHITIDTRHYISDIIPVQCPDSPYIVLVHFSHCVVRNSSLPLELYFNTKSPCSKVTISNSVFIHNGLIVPLSMTLNGPHQVEMKNTHFTEITLTVSLTTSYCIDAFN